MTGDLRESREKHDGAYKTLQSTNIELEDRRRHMEIVLKNIAAGWSAWMRTEISRRSTSRRSHFRIKAEEVRGEHYSRFVTNRTSKLSAL